MRHGSAWRFVAVAAAAAAGVATSVTAIEQRPLPAFVVTGAEGAQTPSEALVRSGKWLMVYVTPSCRTCAPLLRDMGRWDSAALPAATVLLVGDATLAQAQQFVTTALPAPLSGVTWYADAEGQARQALHLSGAPVVVGMKDQRIQWAIAGVLNDPRTLESALRSWVEQP